MNRSNGKKKLRIGIPNTLFAAYHRAYWERLLRLLGFEIVLAAESSQETVERGGRLLPPEFCIPIKVFIGHILNLLEQGVDQVLLPRMTTWGKSNFFCPKLIGLPEIVRYTTGLGEAGMFTPEIACNGLQLRITRLPVGIGICPFKFAAAQRQANLDWQATLAQCRQEKMTLAEAAQGHKKIAKGQLSIGLLGYAYSIYDPFISKGICSKLRDLGVNIVTWEMLAPDLIESQLAKLKRPLFWNFGRMTLGAGLQLLEDPSVDGIIYVTTFGCGPDSVATKILSLEAGKLERPFLVVNLDEHTEDGHLRTRLEAFTDLLIALKEERAG